MRLLKMVIAIVLVGIPVLALAQSEIAAMTGYAQSDNMGQSRGLFTMGVQGRVAVGLEDLTGWVQYTDSAKISTPGGFQFTFGAGTRHWLGRNFFVDGAMSYSHTDATVWTKDVWFAHGYTGLRLRYPAWGGRFHRDEIGVGYQHEIASEAMPSCPSNRTRGGQFFWRHDVPLRGNWFLRGGATVTFYRYRQFEQRRAGEMNILSLGLVYRPRDE